MTRPFFLAIDGAIGVGKTTLARLLQPGFDAELLLEAFDENPFLSDFYGDRVRYAFQTQLFFLLSRYRQRQAAPVLLARGPLVTDYTFAKDSLFAKLNVAGDELEMYERLYDVLADRTPLPDLVIYLRASTDVLMMRIATRDRSYERKMDRAYIDALRQTYERHFSAYTEVPLLTIDTDDLDYVRDSSALEFVVAQVRSALGLGAYQQPLPQMATISPPRVSVAQPETREPATRQEAVEEFLAATEAMGQVGAALAHGPAGWSGRQQAKLGAAIRDVRERLQHVAHTLGVDVREGG